MGATGGSKGRCPFAAWPIIPAALALGACIAVGCWFGYMTKALAATKSMTYLMLMPVPPAMLTVPSLFLATLVATILISVIALGLSLLRARAPAAAASAPYLPAAGAANLLLVLLALWLAAMAAVTVLWTGATLVSEKSTADAAATLKSVDPAIQRLIFQASSGAINGTESGFIVSVGEGKTTRDVDIGKSSCSLFCFVFARAMMSDSMDCFCDVPIMAKIHGIAEGTLKQQLLPASIAVFAAFAFVLGLLVCGAAQFGGADALRRAARGGGCGKGAVEGGATGGEGGWGAGDGYAPPLRPLAN